MSKTTRSDLVYLIKAPQRADNAAQIRSYAAILTHGAGARLDYYVVAAKSAAARNHLATWTHEQSHACGMIQALLPGTVQIPLTTLKSPSYSPLLELASVQSLVDQVDSDQIIASVGSLANLGSRHHTTGSSAADHLIGLFQNAVGSDSEWQIETKSHTGYTQPSVIVRREGAAQSQEVVVIGAHLDSISRSGASAVAPGADDDASGLAILVEIARIFSSNSASFNRTIELQAYAAEEVGLIGSQEIAASYRDNAVAMMQIDMALYGGSGNTGKVFLIHEDTAVDTRRSALHFMTNYAAHAIGAGELPQGATSDHRAFFQQGIPTLFAFEDPEDYNPAIHSAADTLEGATNPALATNIAKLALAFASHYTGLGAAESQYLSQKQEFSLPSSSPLYMAAIADQTTGSSHHFLSISAPPAVATVEFCQLGNRDDLSCSHERQQYRDFIERNGKRLFYRSSSAEVVSGSYRVWAYDSDHNLLSTRTTGITPP